MAGEIPYSAIHNTTYSGGPHYYQDYSGPEFSPPHFPDASLNGWDFEIDTTRLPSQLLSGINQHGGFTLPPDSDFEINDQYGSNLHPINAGNGVQSDNNRFGAAEIPQKRKNTGGRPMIQITKEDLLNCEGRTLEDVKDELKGYKKWTDFRRSKSFPQCVPIYVDYRGQKIPFDLPSTAELGLLQKHIKDGLDLEVETYDIKYFDGEHDLSIRCTSNLEYCLRHAIRSPIVLKVVKRI